MKLRIIIIMIIIFLSIINFNINKTEASRTNEITTDEVWDSDKVILEDLTIKAVITIEPGITIYLGKDVDLNVEGGLKAVGTKENIITFTRYNGASWGYIIIKFGGIFEYCDIIGCKGICDYTDMGIYIRHSKIESDAHGICVAHSDIINNTIIAKNGDALSYSNDPLGYWYYQNNPAGEYLYTIKNNTISSWHGNGIYFFNTNVFNNKLIDVNSTGIYSQGIIRDNYIENGNRNGTGIIPYGDIVENNTVINCIIGIAASENKVTNNTIMNCNKGISIGSYRKDNNLSNNNLQNNEIGISAHSANGFISNNIIENNSIGIDIEDSPSNWYEDEPLHELIISNNSIKNNNKYGINCIQVSYPKIKNNIIIYNGEGGINIATSRSFPPVIENNTISFNKKFGINFGHTHRRYSWGIVKNNIINNNREFGIICKETLNPKILENQISNNGQYGIYIIEKSYPTIDNNKISGHKIGIYIDSTSNATILENIFYDNEKDIINEYDKKENQNNGSSFITNIQIVTILILIIIIGLIIWIYRKKKSKKKNKS